MHDPDQTFVVVSINRKQIAADFNRVGKAFGLSFSDHSNHLDDKLCERAAQHFPVNWDCPGVDHYYDVEIVSIMLERGWITQEQHDQWWEPNDDEVLANAMAEGRQ